MVIGDLAALKSIKYLDYNQNMVYYTEHLGPGAGLKEMIPDYYKRDNEVDTPKENESESDLHILNGCTRLDGKEVEPNEELCTS